MTHQVISVPKGCGWDPVCGVMTYTPSLQGCLEALDHILCQWFKTQGARPLVLPMTLPLSSMARVGYCAHFPQLATFPVCCANDEDALASFSQGPHTPTLTLVHPSPITHLLAPAACYGVYVQLAQGDEPQGTWTVRQTCFRREQEYLPMKRHGQFQMREWVVVGTPENVNAFMALAQSLMTTLEDFIKRTMGLSLEAAVATDPFFHPQESPQYWMQRVSPLKTEWVCEGMAIASLNSHGTTFGEAFCLNSEAGIPYASACLAFGLERWVGVLWPWISQWPEEIAMERAYYWIQSLEKTLIQGASVLEKTV